MFLEHLPASYLDREDIPRVVRTEAGDDVWIYDGRQFPNIGLNAVAGRPRDEYGIDPTSYDEMRRGCWDVDARIDDMNANGVLASMCFPVVPSALRPGVRRSRGQGPRARPRSCVQRLARPLVVRPHPGRFIPLGLLPFWDVDLSVEELTPPRWARCARGFVLGEPVEARATRASTRITGTRSGRRVRTSRSCRACTSARRRRSRSRRPTRRSTSRPRCSR